MVRYLYEKTKGVEKGRKIWSRQNPLYFQIVMGSNWKLIKKVTEAQFSRM